MKAWLLTLFALFALSQAQDGRLFHAAVGLGPITLLINGFPVLSGVQYGVPSNYVPLTPGVSTASILLTNGNSTILAQLTVILAPGNTYSFVYYGNQANILCLLSDSPTVFATQVRFVHLSECAGPVQPLIGLEAANTFPSPLPYGGVTDYVPVPPTVFSVGFRDSTTFVPLVAIPFTFIAGTSTTVYLTGCPGTAQPLTASVAFDQSPILASAPVIFGKK
jgi:hypothetical protein